MSDQNKRIMFEYVGLLFKGTDVSDLLRDYADVAILGFLEGIRGEVEDSFAFTRWALTSLIKILQASKGCSGIVSSISCFNGMSMQEFIMAMRSAQTARAASTMGAPVDGPNPSVSSQSPDQTEASCVTP